MPLTNATMLSCNANKKPSQTANIKNKKKPGFCRLNPQLHFQNALPVETNSNDMTSKFIFSSFISSYTFPVSMAVVATNKLSVRTLSCLQILAAAYHLQAILDTNKPKNMRVRIVVNIIFIECRLNSK